MKKFLAAVLSAAMVFTSVAPALAAGADAIVYDGQNGYSATKISSPTTGSGEVDGLIDDRGQNYAWSAVGYGDDVYVGTCFGAIYQTLKIMSSQFGMDAETMGKAVDALYNGSLYFGDEGNAANTKNRSVLVKINTKTGETSIVHGPTTAGGYRAAIEFQDKLYFAATGAQPYILEVDPATDTTKVVCYSEKPQSALISTGIRGLTVYKDQLVATMIGNQGAYMVASKNPSEGQDSFKVIGTQEDFLDYPAYKYTDSIFGGSIWDIIEYNDKLYITVVTGKDGNKQAFALFSGEPDANGNWNYDLIVGDKADGAEYTYGLGSDRSGAANLITYKDTNGKEYLYVGGYNDPMVALPKALTMEFEELYKDLNSPVCLWRMDESEKFEMVAGEANEVFPEGPTGNMGAGLGSNLNQYVWRMADYDDKLYVGTFDIGSLAYPLMQFTNGDLLNMTKEEWESQINYIKVFLESVMNQGEVATYGLRAETTQENEEVVASLEEMVSIMEDMNEIYEETPVSGTTYSLKNNNSRAEDFLLALIALRQIYEQVKDRLPEEVITKLENIISEETIQNFEYFVGICKYLNKGERGFDLLVSEDGVNFDVITRDGFGDPYNHGCRVFAITDTGLCIGTANPFYGAQVWQLDQEITNAVVEAEGTYDKNPNGELHKELEMEIQFNGNTIDKIECEYNELVEGEDYIVTENGVKLTQSFLDAHEVGEHNITIFFSSGTRGKYALNVIETKDNNNENNNQNNNTNNGSNNGGDNNDSQTDLTDKSESVDAGDSNSVMLYALAMLGSVLAFVMVALKRKQSSK